jgi:hypothetical protein
VREDKTAGPHSLFFDGVRHSALQSALNVEKAWLLLSMNPSTGSGCCAALPSLTSPAWTARPRSGRRPGGRRGVGGRRYRPYRQFRFLRDDALAVRELFEMAGEVTREAVLNSLCTAGAMDGRDGHRAEAFP